MYLLDSGLYPRIISRPALNQAQPLLIMFNLPFPPITALDGTHQLNATGYSFTEKPNRNLVRNSLAVDRGGDLDEFGRSNLPSGTKDVPKFKGMISPTSPC